MNLGKVNVLRLIVLLFYKSGIVDIRNYLQEKSKSPEIYEKTFWQFEEAEREQFFLDSQELVYGKYSIGDLPLLNQIIDFNNLKPKLELKTVYQLLYDMWKNG